MDGWRIEVRKGRRNGWLRRWTRGRRTDGKGCWLEKEKRASGRGKNGVKGKSKCTEEEEKRRRKRKHT